MPTNQEKVSQLLADSHFAFINSQNSESLHLANEAIRLAPKNPDAYQIAGDAYMSLGQYEKAVESYKKAVKLDQNNGNRYFNLGYALATNEKAADAIKNLAKADELGCSPENTVQLYNLLGIICFDIGRYKDALVNLEKAEQIIGVDLDIMKRKVIIYGMKNDIRNGLLTTNQMKLVAPSDYTGYQLAFKLLCQANRLDAAERELEMAKKYAELSMDYYFDCMTFEIQKYQTDKDKQRYNKALTFIEEALKTLKPTSTEVIESYINAAEIYLQLEDPDKTIDCLNAAQNPAESYNLGFDVIDKEFEPVNLTEYDVEEMIEADKECIAEKYGDDRRSKIGYDELDISMEDLIPRENTIIAMTSLGYIKRMTVDNFKAQNRGGRGIKGMQTIDEDYIEDLLMTTTHHYLNFFTNMGRVYRLKAYEIPEAGRTARGTAIVNLLQLTPGEKITAMIPIHEYSDDKNLFMVTKTGIVKKTPLMEFSNVRKNGLTAINLREEDELIEVKITDSNSEIFLVTKQGMCIRFQETDVRATGRASMGVIGMNLSPGDEIIGMQLQTQGSDLLIVSENGMGKRTNMDEFTVQKRGGKGVKCYKIVEKTGDVVGAKAVNDDNEIMMITTEGIIIQLRVQDISTLSRITSGVKLINLDNGVKVAQIAKVREKLSNGDHEFDNLEEAMEEVAQEAVSEDEDEAEENLIFPTEDSEDDE